VEGQSNPMTQPRRDMTTELTPQFAVTVRGYDRAQVDDYVDTLRNWHGNATARMQAAETEAAQLREQVVRLRQRVADLEQQTGQEPPRTITALGDRVTRILQLAEEAAAQTRTEAEAEARMIVSKAEDEAEANARTTRARQVEVETFLTSATEQAQQAVQHAEQRASEAAARLTSEAEARAAQRESEARERSQQIIAEAEANRARVLEELAAERSRAGAEVEALRTKRDEIRTGLSHLQESLHSTLGELPPDQPASVHEQSGPAETAGAADGETPGVAGDEALGAAGGDVPAASAADAGEAVLFDHEAVNGSSPSEPPDKQGD
jgi:cell division septum initiation protein DivIVA